MGRQNKYSPELRERAVRMVFEHAPEYPSQWGAIRSVAEKIGCPVEVLRRWVRQAERDTGQPRPHDRRAGSLEAARTRKFRAPTRERDSQESVRIFRTGGARPPSEVMVAFIDDHREQFGVEPICRVLPIAPSTYFKHKAEQWDPARRSPRAQSDAEWRAIIQRIWNEQHQVYGPRKVWRQMGREGLRVARCRVRRLMREMGLAGAVRGRAWTTTTQPSPAADRPSDLVDRTFTATRPNQLWVSDLSVPQQAA